MEVDEIKSVRSHKADHLRKTLSIDPYGQRTQVSNKVAPILDNFEEGKTVQLAGRIMASRSHGKVLFADLQDLTGKIQLFIKLENPDSVLSQMAKSLDIGDIIYVEGTLFTTKTGQKSVRIAEEGRIVLLAKALMSLPEKWHGLKDVELRYRQRYVDLIVNANVREIFIKRSQIIKF